MAPKITKKERTRARIIDAASQGFKAYGYNGIGVDGIAKKAGVTSGAFYAHLGSKESAFSQILVTNFDKTMETIPNFQQKHGQNWVVAFTDYYLGKEHCEDIACGCWMTALTPEITKSTSALQEQYERQITQVIKAIAMGLSGGSEKDKIDRAWAMLSTLIGGLNMARAIDNETLVNQISSTVQTAAIKLAGKAKKYN